MTRRKPKELPIRIVGKSKIEQALAGIGRYFLGGYRTRTGDYLNWRRNKAMRKAQRQMRAIHAD